MAELHVIGQIVGASGFPSANLYCKWGTALGTTWKLLEGKQDGQTQVDHPKDGTLTRWCHPIDMHLSCQGVQEWPKLHFQVWHEDVFGRSELYGYGFCHVPSAPGRHVIRCDIWRPVGSYMDRFISFFMGGSPELSDEQLVYTSNDRLCVRTEASGHILLHLNIITRNFDKYGVET